MVTSAPTLQPVFAVPLGGARLEGCEGLNRELESLFLARENEQHRNPMPSHIPQRETFESRFNLFRWPEPCVQELRKFVLDTVVATVLQATRLVPADLARLTLHNHTWFHITRYAGSFISHNHPMASWSAVYCVRAGESVPEEPASGVLRLLDPRSGAGAYRDAGNSRLHPMFAPAPLDFRLADGQVLVFPSYLFHEVTPFYGRDLRITVASNCWFA
jgi:putative 2-oxoglutarate-Fe(II)-dependent oxygenase superfamily protein